MHHENYHWSPIGLNTFSDIPHYHTFITTWSHSPTTKNKSNSINLCVTNYFKSCNIDVKFKQLCVSVRLGLCKQCTHIFSYNHVFTLYLWFCIWHELKDWKQLQNLKTIKTNGQHLWCIMFCQCVVPTLEVVNIKHSCPCPC